MRGRESPSPFQCEQDQWQEHMWNKVALAISEWLTENQIDLNRPIASLKKRELLGMAWAAVGTYSDARVQRARELENAPDPRQLTLPIAGVT